MSALLHVCSKRTVTIFTKQSFLRSSERQLNFSFLSLNLSFRFGNKVDSTALSTQTGRTRQHGQLTAKNFRGLRNLMHHFTLLQSRCSNSFNRNFFDFESNLCYFHSISSSGRFKLIKLTCCRRMTRFLVPTSTCLISKCFLGRSCEFQAVVT